MIVLCKSYGSTFPSVEETVCRVDHPGAFAGNSHDAYSKSILMILKKDLRWICLKVCDMLNLFDSFMLEMAGRTLSLIVLASYLLA